MSSLIFKMKKMVTLLKSLQSIKYVNSLILLGISNNFVCLWCLTSLQPISLWFLLQLWWRFMHTKIFSSVSPILPPQLQEPAVTIYKSSLKGSGRSCPWEQPSISGDKCPSLLSFGATFLEVVLDSSQKRW